MATAGLLAVSTGIPVGAALIVAAAPAQAAGFQVTSLADSGVGSLRAAVAAANAAAGADTITFGVSGTINLTGGELLLEDDVTVQGPGATALTVNAGGESRIFHATPDAQAVVISGLTLTNGQAPSRTEYYNNYYTGEPVEVVVHERGGAVYIQQDIYSGASSARLASVVVTNSDSGRSGGGASIRSNDITVANSTITGNTANSGAGLLLDDYYGSGNGTVHLQNTTITDNAGYQAVNVRAATVVVSGSTISNNHATDEANYGGYGVRLSAGNGGSVTISNSSIADNDGLGASAYGEVSVSGSTFARNGGTGLSAGGSSVVITGSSFADNARGARLDTYSDASTVTVSSSTFSGNRLGLTVRAETATVQESVISGNGEQGSTGGGLALYGIYSGSSAALVSRTQITGNTNMATYNDVPTGNGGGVFVAPRISATFENTTVSGNTAAVGGGVFLSDLEAFETCVEREDVEPYACVTYEDHPAPTVVFTSSTITGNAAENGGGGISGSAGSKTLRNTVVANNTASETAGDLARRDVSDAPFALDFSLVEAPGVGTTSNVTPGSNIVGVDPQLGALASNGGPTKTQLPAATSPVIDKGKSFGVANDQRGLARPVDQSGIPNATGGNGADIGAVELAPGQGQPPPPSLPPATAKPTLGTPTLKGKGKVGKKLTAVVTVSGCTPSYQWLKNGKPIKKKATQAKYKVTAKDLRKKISVRVTCAVPGKTPLVATSKAKKIK